VAFIVKNIDTIFFTCFIGKPDSSHLEINKNEGKNIKKATVLVGGIA
jgi:hypothetical protein